MSWFEVLKIWPDRRVGSHLDHDDLVDIYFDTIEKVMESGHIENALHQWDDEKEVYQLDRYELSDYDRGDGVELFDGKYYVRIDHYEEEDDPEVYNVEEANVYYDDYSGEVRVASYTGLNGYYFDGARQDAKESGGWSGSKERETIERAMANLLDNWEEYVPKDRLDDLNEEKWKDKQ